ncbi:MAG TPA: CHAT domain-containing tetratricopeptide repeat protein [Pyrinomonadaceae bacterium]|jgi:CHAT domain-containing protein/Tfp pilus assembly protein PilF|nr:CHAT domain-containing tetratricopeptide repeat protein [Pyrinomonadaceae bacterium]
MIRRFLVLVALSCCLLPLLAQAQGSAQDQIIEEDFRVAGVSERQQAVETLSARVDEFRNAGQLVEAARTLNRVGRFQIRLFVQEEAIATFQKALQLLDQQPDIETRIDSLNGIASGYGGLGNCELAEPQATQALTLSKQNNYVAGQAEALLLLSDCQNHSDHALAVRTALGSLELWRSIARKRGMAEAHLSIGLYQMAQNDLTESAESLQAALSLYRELNAADRQASILIYLGFMEFRKGAWQDSMAYYTQARSMIDEKAEPIKMGQLTAGLAEAFLESGLPDVALAKFREALGYYRLTKNHRSVMTMNWSIGKSLYLAGRYQEALDSLQSALQDSEASKDPMLIAFCHDFLGRTYSSLGNYAAALTHFQLALDGYLGTKNTMEAARIRALIGQVYEQQGKFDKAGNYYEVALETFRRQSDAVNESATLYATGRLELKRNKLDLAEDYLRQSIDVTENIRRVSQSSDLTAAVSATVHERYETYIECLMRKHVASPLGGFDKKAFETSEFARARSLSELLRATQTNLMPGLDPQLAGEEKSLRQMLRVKEDSRVALLGRDYQKEELEALTNQLSDLESKYKQVTDTIRNRYPAYDQLSRPAAWDLNRIRQEVIADDQTVLLEFSLGAARSYVWTITRDSISSYELPSEGRINAAAEKLYGLLTTAADAQTERALDQASRELSQLILSPVAAALNKPRVIVVADGALNYVPFQLLPAPNAVGEPLVANYEVINIPSASILGQLRLETRQRRAAPKILAAFGDPVFASNYAQRKTSDAGADSARVQVSENDRWPHALRDIEMTGDAVDRSSLQPLFYAARELASLRALAGTETLMFSGFDATPENLKQADLTKFAILHFATHGVLDPKRPENSGLFLSMVDRQGKAQNGFVSLQDIYGLHAPVDLVVLSACRTGLGKDVRGEGLIGLTRGFMYAGASSVLASLWKVDDEATSELMKRFYINMLQLHMPPASALRAAQNSIRQEPQWRAPYFWAAFTLQGEYRLPINYAPARSGWEPRRIAIGLAVLLLLISGFGWYLRAAKTKGNKPTPVT